MTKINLRIEIDEFVVAAVVLVLVLVCPTTTGVVSGGDGEW